MIALEAAPDRIVGRLESGALDFYGGYGKREGSGGGWLAGVSWKF